MIRCWRECRVVNQARVILHRLRAGWDVARDDAVFRRRRGIGHRCNSRRRCACDLDTLTLDGVCANGQLFGVNLLVDSARFVKSDVAVCHRCPLMRAQACGINHHAGNLDSIRFGLVCIPIE